MTWFSQRYEVKDGAENQLRAPRSSRGGIRCFNAIDDLVPLATVLPLATSTISDMTTGTPDRIAIGAFVASPRSILLSMPAKRALSAVPARAAMIVATIGVASGQISTNYGTPAPNSTGAPASIAGSGSAVVPLNNPVLTSSGLPLNAVAYFLCSRTQGFVQNPGGRASNLCLGNPIGRRVGGVIPNSGASGVVNVAADLSVMPQPNGAVMVLPGETWNFQCWYRDAVGGSATSNFSDGLAGPGRRRSRQHGRQYRVPGRPRPSSRPVSRRATAHASSVTRHERSEGREVVADSRLCSRLLEGASARRG